MSTRPFVHPSSHRNVGVSGKFTWCHCKRFGPSGSGPKLDWQLTTYLLAVSFWISYLLMPFSKRLPTTLLSLVLIGCAAGEAEDQPELAAFEMAYADAPVAPRPDDVRFFERPNLLSEMRNRQAPMPEVVLIERDPWKQVMGSDSPRFALYEDGRVIYREGEKYRSVKLSAAELHSFRKSLATAHNSTRSGGYDVALATDQPDNSLLLYRGDPVYLNVYGSLDDEQVVARLPRSVREAYDTVRTFSHTSSEPWMPEKIEVMVQPYEYAPGPSIRWNEDWPGFSHPTTVQRGDSYSLFLPSTERKNLQQFLATRNEKGAIEINGRKWAASTRTPFPSEELWMAPNREVDGTPN